jgi:hypothetical protein
MRIRCERKSLLVLVKANHYNLSYVLTHPFCAGAALPGFADAHDLAVRNHLTHALWENIG